MMAGTKAGGLRAAATNKKRHGADFYKKLGAKGGAKGTTGGFYDRDLARTAGALGGKVSKRGYKAVRIGDTWVYEKQPSSTSSRSGLNSPNAHTCRNCLKVKFLDKNGICPTCNEVIDGLDGAAALVAEAEAIDRGEVKSEYKTVLSHESGVRRFVRKLGL
jgi:hypothetical protein